MPRYSGSHQYLPCLTGWDHNMVEGGNGVHYCSRCAWVPTKPAAKPRRHPSQVPQGVTILLEGKTGGASKARLLVLRDGDTCHYCGVRLGSHNRTMDHIIPASKRGTRNLANLVLACVSCNQRRGDMDYEAYVAIYGSQAPKPDPSWDPARAAKLAYGRGSSAAGSAGGEPCGS